MGSIVKAAEAAKTRGVTVVGLLGKGGGAVGPICDIVLHAPGSRSDRIQELHMLALHAAGDSRILRDPRPLIYSPRDDPDQHEVRKCLDRRRARASIARGGVHRIEG